MDDNIIEVNQLCRDYDGFRAVNQLNFQIRRGEVFGFLGPNGAGKTTSINMIVGLLQPTEGQVLINGKDVAEIDKGSIGICPQEIVLWENLTCKESLHLMGKMYEVPSKTLKSRVQELLDELFLTDKANVLVSKLSGGMKRRLNLALALIHQPEIIFLDEPSEGLDPQSRRVLWKFVRRLRDEGNKTVILTTHLMEEADKLCDRVAIIDHGELLRLDSPENLKKEIGVGDVIDMKLSNPQKNKEAIKLLNQLKDIDSVIETDERLNLRALDAVAKLPQIMQIIDGLDLRINDLSIRQNTLEDVFIYLTGTGMRE